MNGADDLTTSPRGFFDNYNCTSSKLSPLSRSSSSSTSFSISPSLSRSNSFSRSPSLSRTTSLRSRTPTPASASASHLLRSMSRKNIDAAAASPARGRGSLSRSLSQKGSSTTGFPAGLLSRSSSWKVSSTAAFPPAGSHKRSSSWTGSTRIMYSKSNGLIKPPAIEKNLECTLEELCFGCIKRIIITRDVVTNNGQIVKEKEMLTIKVKPGWRKGMKITFEGMGNETPGTHPADIIFAIAEKSHPLFSTKGDDLVLAVGISLLNALTGCTLSVPLLGGEKMSLAIDDIIEPGYEKIIAGQGMPRSKGQGNRGNLIIKFLVEFPRELTDRERADLFSILRESR